ncbi:hypothetical protein BCR33DRAFT_714906, partial [Rhizoclosmatium globosum]
MTRESFVSRARGCSLTSSSSSSSSISNRLFFDATDDSNLFLFTSTRFKSASRRSFASIESNDLSMFLRDSSSDFAAAISDSWVFWIRRSRATSFVAVRFAAAARFATEIGARSL